MVDAIGSQPSIPRSEHTTPRETVLNEKVLAAANVLKRRNQIVAGTQITDSGKIIFSQQQANITTLSSSEKSIAGKIDGLLQEYEERNAQALAQARKVDGVLDAAIINGAIVITYDSSQKEVPNVLGYFGKKTSPRGDYHTAKEDNLGTLLIDLNPEKREEGKVPPSRTLLHELGHHNHALVMYALGTEEDVNMVSSTLAVTSALYGKNFPDAPHSGHVRQEAIKHDATQYGALLGRLFTPQEIENVTQQREYLNELHSSFLERKFSWFNTHERVYNNIAQGQQGELVGQNVEDQQITHKMMGILQAAFIIDHYFFNPNISQLPDYIRAAIPEWQEIYGKMAGIIGSSFTVRQCELLLEEQWQAFTRTHSNILQNNQQMLTQILGDWKTANIGLADNVRVVLGLPQ